jgi:hypothetical protein
VRWQDTSGSVRVVRLVVAHEIEVVHFKRMGQEKKILRFNNPALRSQQKRKNSFDLLWFVCM